MDAVDLEWGRAIEKHRQNGEKKTTNMAYAGKFAEWHHINKTSLSQEIKVRKIRSESTYAVRSRTIIFLTNNE